MGNEELIIKIKEGDQEAFREIYEIYKEKVYTTAYFLMSDKSVLDDILQEVFIQVFLKINTLKNNKAFDCWIYRVTVNVCMKYGRTISKNKHESDETILYALKEENIEYNPEDRFIKTTNNKDVMNLIYDLPEKQRIGIILFYYNNMSIKDIAYVTESSETAIKARLFKGKKNLEKSINKLGIEEGILIGY